MRITGDSRRKRVFWGAALGVTVAAVALGLGLGVPTPNGCGGGTPTDDLDDLSGFDPDENDDTVGAGPDGKEDSATSGYRTGCGNPIRTGKYALKGEIVGPSGAIPTGYVVVDGEKIVSVGKTAPAAGITIVDTGGIIFPGLIDGHGHVEYNHIPIADLGKRYGDRDQWPGASLYQTLVKDPKNAVTKAGLQCEALRHGEVRALVGGTTAIQGTPQVSCIRPLVRNLEQPNFCQDKVRQNVMDASGFNRSISGKPSFVDSVKSDIAAKKLDAVVVHLGEGIDDHAKGEWAIIKGFGLNLPELVVIHGTAFGAAEYADMGKAGVKMIWSPLSNLLLYGKTADVPTAMANGVLVSLGSDWAPSGSPNLLGELKVADHVNQKLWAGKITDEELVQMVTINPATAFGWDKFVGSVEAGKYADLMVIAKSKTTTSPYRALIEAPPQDVLLVTIAGDALYGSTALLDEMGKKGDYEVIQACGQPRGIDTTVIATDVPNGTETLATVEQKLGAVNPKLTPVVDCTNAAALKAYAGTPMQ